ncbi:MAG: histidine phosphatase family protein [Thermomicrobiales bacterium]
MTMDRLILVKHAFPAIVPDAPPRTWLLSDAGRRAAARHAAQLAAYDPVSVVTSVEPKAAETGQIIAAQIGLTAATAPGLHEHERGVVSFDGDNVFHQEIVRFFSEPAAVVYGTETADAAHARFEVAVRAVCDAQPPGTLVVIAHGTVITLLVARANGLDPFPFWKNLGLPSSVVVERSGFRLVDTISSPAG